LLNGVHYKSVVTNPATLHKQTLCSYAGYFYVHTSKLYERRSEVAGLNRLETFFLLIQRPLILCFIKQPNKKNSFFTPGR